MIPIVSKYFSSTQYRVSVFNAIYTVSAQLFLIYILDPRFTNQLFTYDLRFHLLRGSPFIFTNIKFEPLFIVDVVCVNPHE